MDLAKFVNHFGFRVVRVNEGRCRQVDSWSAYNAPNFSSYYQDHDAAMIEMEIDRRRLEHMANYFEQSERLDEQDRDEAYLRRQYPGLKEAYDKYQMLLALYK
jgi:hypothetical protein